MDLPGTMELGYEICYNVQKAVPVINGSFCTVKSRRPCLGFASRAAVCCMRRPLAGQQLGRRKALSGENVAVIGHFLLWKTNRRDFSDGARPENCEKTEAA